MISKEFEFEKEVKVRRKRKVVKGKVYEYEDIYINIGRVSLSQEFKQYVGKKVKVKLIIEIEKPSEGQLLNDLRETYLSITPYPQYISAKLVYEKSKLIKYVMTYSEFIQWLKELRLKLPNVILTWDFWLPEDHPNKYNLLILTYRPLH